MPRAIDTPTIISSATTTAVITPPAQSRPAFSLTAGRWSCGTGAPAAGW
jgi:hypothetical protein